MASHQVGPYRPSQTIITPLPADKDAWRLEIDELLTDPDLTNIFLLALKRLQDEPVLKAEADDWLSYYNLAGTSSYLVNRAFCIHQQARHSRRSKGEVE